MAVTQNNYTGNGSTVLYNFTFPYLQQTDVQVRLDGVLQATTTYSFANATTIQFNSAPGNGVKIIIFRNTDNDNKKATFYPGSAIKAEDLNDNLDQILYVAQEVDNNAMSSLGDTQMQGDLEFGQGMGIVFEGSTTDDNETRLGVIDPTADRNINLPDVSGTVVTTGDTGTVATGMIADNAVTMAKLNSGALPTDITIASANIVNGTIVHEDLASNSVTSSKITDQNVTTAKIADNAVTMAKLANGALPTDITVASANIVNGTITHEDLASNAVTSSKITDQNVTTAKIADSNVTTDKIADANITTAKIADTAITTAKIQGQAITNAKLAGNSVDVNKIASDSITTVKIAADAVTSAKIADDAVTTAKIADAELTTLAGMPSATASQLASSTALTATTTNLNITQGMTKATSLTTNSDTEFPTSKAVNDRILSVTNALGGFVAIADKDSFPTSHPDPSGNAGTVVSISNAQGISVNSSGVGTLATRAGGSDAVIINGFPSALRGGATVGSATNANPYVLPANVGLQVQTTGTAHTYDYHKYLINEEDANKLSGEIQDFQERYRVAASAPTSSLNDGDLYFDTTANKMKVYNASSSSWDDVATPGNFLLNTISSSSGSGGGSATFNGTATRFTLSNPPDQYAQQLLVSIDGVIQKPNSGTSPSEGFAIDGNDIIFASAPPSGASYFIVTQGSSVNIGTPSDNTVSAAKIQNGAITNDKVSASAAIAKSKLASLDIVNADVNASAAIAGTKISPDFGSQNIVTTGGLTVDTNTLHVDTTNNRVGIGTLSPSVSLDIEATTPTIRLTDSDASGTPECQITAGGGDLVLSADRDNEKSDTQIQFQTDGSTKLVIDSSGRLLIGKTSTTLGHPLQVQCDSNANGIVVYGRSSDDIGELAFYENDGTTKLGEVQYRQNELNIRHRSQGADIKFTTTPSGGSITDRLIIKSDGKVGINETAPESKLTVFSTDRHVQQLIAENGVTAGTTSGTIYRQQYTSAGTSRRMGFFGIKRKGGSGDQTANFVMELCPDNSTNLGVASTASYTTPFTFTNTGMMEVKSGGGVRFHNYGDGTGIDSNLLDDYEEGTFTPEIKGTDGSTPTSYYHQEGGYTKIGRFVTCIMRIRINSASGLNGDLMLDNLPFTVLRVNASTGLAGFGHPAYFTSANSNLTTIVCTPVGGSDTAYFYGQASASTGMGNLNTTYINSNFDIRLYLTYYAS